MHWELSTLNATDTEILQRTPARWQEIGFLEGYPRLDQLGRGGRIWNPRSQHFNAEAVEPNEGTGGSVLQLPPYGKHFNPGELLFNDLKQYDLRRTPFPQPLASVEAVIRDYMERVGPAHLPDSPTRQLTGAA